MSTITKQLKAISATLRRAQYLLIAVGLLMAIVSLAVPESVSAASLTTRRVTLGSSATSTRTTHTFNFTAATTANIGSIVFDYCTTASGACTGPTGLDTEEASLEVGAEVGATGFDVHANTDTNTVVLTRSAASLAASTAVTIPLGTGTGSTDGPTNPSTANETFFVRITTYTSADGTTGSTDTGVVAASTASQISLSGSIGETLVFCTGTSITGTDCGTVSGSSVNFGSLSSTAASTGTSVMAASTNADSGYSITVNGATMTSGSDTITALTTQTASSTGSEQFGLNLKDNATPNVGAEVSGSGSGTATANYGTADQFRFVTGDSVGSAAGSTAANTFTVSYLVNIGGATEPGNYTATMTYICTPTF